MLSAFSVVSLHLISGQFSSWFGANNFLLGARRVRSFNVMFGALATWYSLSQHIWSSKLLQSTCSHDICETSPQSPLFRLVTWSASGSGSGSEENGRLNTLYSEYDFEDYETDHFGTMNPRAPSLQQG